MNAQELQKHINKEITACQLAGSEYRFKCLICGKTHKASSRKTIERCFSKLQKTRYYNSPYAPYVEEMQFYRDGSKASIRFIEAVINILLPGIPIRALYQKTDRIINFLKDFYMSVANVKDEYVYMSNNRIYFNYHNKLTEQNPCLLLLENYNKHLAIEYKKTLRENIKLFKNIILNIAQVMRCHADLFIKDSSLINVADHYTNHYTKIESIAKKTKKIIQNETGKTYYSDDICNLISQLIFANYRDFDNEMAQPYEYRIHDYEINSVRDVRGCVSYCNYGEIRAHANKSHENQYIRIIVSLKGREYSEGLHSLIVEVAEQLLPIEKLARYMMEYAKKEYRRQGRNYKPDSCQLSLNALEVL